MITPQNTLLLNIMEHCGAQEEMWEGGRLAYGSHYILRLLQTGPGCRPLVADTWPAGRLMAAGPAPLNNGSPTHVRLTVPAGIHQPGFVIIKAPLLALHSSPRVTCTGLPAPAPAAEGALTVLQMSCAVLQRLGSAGAAIH
ncbi:hypothetical protein EYF80_000349 [Liparis tanakae]|uniref:Uncharacterized protein n=1 Tax=Liparis tanakae TaxID=230148 RepID=A0A4Z2JGG7_9TELE|nr:hypothetical protein EYF80_000349 [Liparis tanakae]